MSIYIDSAGMRVNIYAPFRHNDAVFGNLTSPEARELCGVVEVAEPAAPEDYTEDTYYRTEQATAPYVVYTRKSEEQITQVRRSKALAQIAALEQGQLISSLRMQREELLASAEAYAASALGLTPAQLYSGASAPDAPVAFITYKRMKDLDNEIKSIREAAL